MEGGLDLFSGGGGGGVSSRGSEVVEQDYVGLSSEASSAEAELDLGLGLSLGGGGGKVKPCGWGEYGRILTAKDFPSIMSSGSSASSSSSSGGRANKASPPPVTGTKRAADSITQEAGSAQGVSQVVGWPPIRAYRINSLNNQTKVQAVEGDKMAIESNKDKDNMKKKTDNSKTNVNAEEKGHPGKSLFVKVNMDGLPIGRKVDLSVHASYESLSETLEDMFTSTTTTTKSSIRSNEVKEHGAEAPKPSKLLDGLSEFVLTYEDKDGDWMLVGDVPWGMFLNTVKRLRIMRKSEANGLAPRFQHSGTRQRNKPI